MRGILRQLCQLLVYFSFLPFCRYHFYCFQIITVFSRFFRILQVVIFDIVRGITCRNLIIGFLQVIMKTCASEMVQQALCSSQADAFGIHRYLQILSKQVSYTYVINFTNFCYLHYKQTLNTTSIFRSGLKFILVSCGIWQVLHVIFQYNLLTRCIATKYNVCSMVER